MKHCRTVKLFFGVSLALLSGCASVGPEPRLLADELQYAETVKNLYKADGNWWRQYNDPELNNLIETALANNPDYLKAAFNVEKELANSRKYFLRIHQSFLVNYDYITKMNFFNITISMNGKEMELKISEDRQKEVRRQLCTMAAGKAVIE